jgi:hypothetical protein
MAMASSKSGIEASMARGMIRNKRLQSHGTPRPNNPIKAGSKETTEIMSEIISRLRQQAKR